MAAESPARRPGLPPTRPRLRAALSPASVRSAISARSSWATARSVDRVAQAAEMRALGFELFDDSEQVADRAGEAIEPDDDQGLAGADLAQQAPQHWPGAIGAGGLLRIAYRRLRRGA